MFSQISFSWCFDLLAWKEMHSNSNSLHLSHWPLTAGGLNKLWLVLLKEQALLRHLISEGCWTKEHVLSGKAKACTGGPVVSLGQRTQMAKLPAFVSRVEFSCAVNLIRLDKEWRNHLNNKAWLSSE